MGDLPVVFDNGASCHMSHSSTGMVNYREAKATICTTSGGKRYPIEGYDALSLTFQSSGEVRCICCFATLSIYLASATTFFSKSRSR